MLGKSFINSVNLTLPIGQFQAEHQPQIVFDIEKFFDSKIVEYDS